jgi:replicative DNA helicase
MSSVLKEFAVSHDVVAAEGRKLIESRYMNPVEVSGYRYGFDKLDYLTRGIHSVNDTGTNELTVVAARSGTGKSSFGMTVCLNVAVQFKREYPGLEVRIVLLEMTPTACYTRLVSQLADVPLRKIQTGYMTAIEKRMVDQAMKRLDGLPIVYLQGAHSTEFIDEFVRAESKAKRRCGYWMVDHIGIVPAPNTRNQSFTLGAVARDLHFTARKYAPGLVLAQLNREGLKRKDPTPGVMDLYGSDQITHHADNLIFLYRPETLVRRNADEELEEELAFIIIEKQREGVAGKKIPAVYLPRQVLWCDAAEDLEGEEDVA